MSLGSHSGPRLAITKTFTKGGQVTLHNFRMIRQVLGVTILLTLAGGAIFCVAKTWTDYMPYQRYLIGSAWWADIRLGFSGNRQQERQSFTYPDGKTYQIPCIAIQQNRLIQGWARDFEGRLVRNLYLTLWAMAGIFGAVCAFWFWRGQVKKAKIILSGSRIVTAKELQAILRKQQIASPFVLGGVSLRLNTETQHLMVCGTTGTGKSTCLSQLLPQIRQRGQRAVIVDTTGEFVSRFYNAETDILINPFDGRSVGWNPWVDCRFPYHYDELASAFIPQTGHDRFWADSARTVFAEGLKLLAGQDIPTVDALLKLLLETSIRDLFESLRNTPAANLVDPAGDRTAMSIRAHLAPYLKCLEYLCQDKDGFSIRDWVEAGPAALPETLSQDASTSPVPAGEQPRNQEKGCPPQWLFIFSTPDQRETLRPLITGLLTSAVNSLMGCGPDPDRRLWFVIDELVSLNKQETISKALAEIRKYGGCIAVGIQNIPQLQDRYGIAETKSLTSLFNTRIVFRNGDPDSARHLSQMLGEQEVREAVENISYGAHQMRDGVSLNEQQRTKPVVSANDIMALDDLEAYLKLPGDLPIARIKFKVGQASCTALPLVPESPSAPFPEETTLPDSQEEQHGYVKPGNAGEKSGTEQLQPPPSPTDLVKPVTIKGENE